MSGPGNETLTAALRRLGDERASGLLTVATPGRDVVIEVDEGLPVTIGPVLDVSDRTGPDATAAVTTVATVDELVDRLVAAIVVGDVDWTWDADADADADRIPVPDGLTQELARRAVDAAQALATLDPDDVLEPAHDVATTGELDRVRRLFDGERTITDVAQAASLTVPAAATMAAALVAGGALALDDDEPADDEPAAVSWTDTVAAADDDEDDDEPELWVMDEPDEPVGDDGDDTPEPGATETRRLAPTALRDVGPSPAEEPAPPAAAVDEDDDTGPDADETVAPAASEDPGWNDTSWLDELGPTGGDRDDPPVLAAGDDDTRAALGSVLSELGGEELFGDASPDDEDDEDDVEPTPTDGDDTIATRREPRAEPGDVAEFLRELSRLALDDD